MTPVLASARRADPEIGAGPAGGTTTRSAAGERLRPGLAADPSRTRPASGSDVTSYFYISSGKSPERSVEARGLPAIASCFPSDPQPILSKISVPGHYRTAGGPAPLPRPPGRVLVVLWPLPLPARAPCVIFPRRASAPLRFRLLECPRDFERVLKSDLL